MIGNSNNESNFPNELLLTSRQVANVKRSLYLQVKIPSIGSLATTAGITAIENKIPDVDNLAKRKTDYDAKLLDIKSKRITTADYNTFTS